MSDDAKVCLSPSMHRSRRGRAGGHARGTLSRTMARTQFPFTAAIAMPDRGLGTAGSNAIRDWHAQRGCRQVTEWGDGTLIFRFATEELARAFGDAFG